MRGIEILNLNARVQAQVLAAVQTCIQEGSQLVRTNFFSKVIIINNNKSSITQVDLLVPIYSSNLLIYQKRFNIILVVSNSLFKMRNVKWICYACDSVWDLFQASELITNY